MWGRVEETVATNLTQILKLEVPLVVLLGERSLRISEVLSLVPGSIIELTKPANAELDLLVNNKPIAKGAAVKVGENFGVRIHALGNLKDRIRALGDKARTAPGETVSPSTAAEMSPEQLAEALLSGQV